MANETSNDNHVSPSEDPRGPDAHGQTAMLLVESLIHGLIARSVIDVADAIDIVDVAADVRKEIADLGQSPAMTQKSLTMLSSISASLENDLPSA